MLKKEPIIKIVKEEDPKLGTVCSVFVDGVFLEKIYSGMGKTKLEAILNKARN